MKKIAFTLIYLFATSLSVFSQNMYSVNNNTDFSADFDNLQTAINTVPAGSILIVQGSGQAYGNIDISKQLVILGPGFHLNNQPHPFTQANKSSADVWNVTMHIGASGSIISGMNILVTLTLDSCHNTLIESNKVDRGIDLYYSNNCTISKNFVQALGGSTPLVRVHGSGSTTIRNNILYDDANNLFIQLWYNGINVPNVLAEYNTFLRSDATSTTTQNSFQLYTTGAPISLTLRNNILANLQTSPVTNDFGATVANNAVFTLQNNVFSDGSYSTSTGAVNNVSTSTLFQYINSSAYDLDYKVQNATGSPAIGAGTSGSTCGAYGGPDPYSLSGLNLIPNIYEINIPMTSSSTNGIDIQIKAKANQ